MEYKLNISYHYVRITSTFILFVSTYMFMHISKALIQRDLKD